MDYNNYNGSTLQKISHKRRTTTFQNNCINSCNDEGNPRFLFKSITQPVAGSLLGISSGLLYGVVAKLRGKPFTRSCLGKFGLYGNLIGLTAAFSFAYYRLRNADEFGWKDRAWRLQRNIEQQRCDIWATSFGLVGALCSTYAYKKAGSTGSLGLRMVGGFSMGTIMGIGAFLVYISLISKKKKEDEKNEDKKN